MAPPMGGLVRRLASHSRGLRHDRAPSAHESRARTATAPPWSGAAASSGSLNPLSESNATIAAKRMESVPLAAIPPRLAQELRHRWDTDIGRAWRDWHGESGEIGVADTFPLLRSRVHALTLRDLLIPRRVKAAKPLVGVQLVVNDAPKAPSAALARNPGLATTPP